MYGGREFYIDILYKNVYNFLKEHAHLIHRLQEGMMREESIKKQICDLGADVCKIANINRFDQCPEGFSPLDVLKDCHSVISYGIALPKGLSMVDSRFIYGHYNYDLCHEIDRIALKGAKYLEEEFDAIAVPMPSDSPYEYWDEEKLTGKGIISMKHTAVLAGLGQLGKNTLLLNPQYGNRLVLGAILTTLDLVSDELCESICIKECNKCITNCPSEAIQANGTVIQKNCRTNAYGRTKRGFDTVECNRCRTVCPMKDGRER